MPPATVGEIFGETRPAVTATTPVGEALDAVRTSGPEQTVYYVYVVEAAGQLAGVVSVRELLNADDKRPVSAVATEQVVSVRDCDLIKYAATVFAEHEFTALPVVDDGGRLLGTLHPNSVIDALDGEDPAALLAELVPEDDSSAGEMVAYECARCTTTVTADENPRTCPNCGGQLRSTRIE